jgi:hypothetical protein
LLIAPYIVVYLVLVLAWVVHYILVKKTKKGENKKCNRVHREEKQNTTRKQPGETPRDPGCGERQEIGDLTEPGKTRKPRPTVSGLSPLTSP